MSAIKSSSSKGGGGGAGRADAIVQFIASSLQCQDEAGIDPGAIADAYCDGLTLVWDGMTPWIGPLGARAVLRRATDIAGREWPFLLNLSVTDKGLDREHLSTALADIPLPTATEGLVTLLTQIVAVLDNVAGDVLVKSVLSKLASRSTSNS